MYDCDAFDGGLDCVEWRWNHDDHKKLGERTLQKEEAPLLVVVWMPLVGSWLI